MREGGDQKIKGSGGREKDLSEQRGLVQGGRCGRVLSQRELMAGVEGRVSDSASWLDL